MNIFVSAVGWVGGVQAAAASAPAAREISWISVALLGLAVAMFFAAQLALLYSDRRWPVIPRLPFNVRYDLKRIAERERRSLDQKAVRLIEEALEAREAARYGRVSVYGAREAS